MRTAKTRTIIRMISLFLILSIMLPTGAQATIMDPIQPRASYYLSSYNGYVYPAGSSLVQVYFSASSADYLDEIGCLSVSIYESTDNSTWTWKKTFTHDSTSGMLGYDKFYHSGHVDYQGVAGRYYKAFVTIWGGDNGDGDSRSFWTSAKKAT